MDGYILFPRRVESTMIHPSFCPIISNKCRFNLLVLSFQTPVCPSVLLKYALPLLCFG